VELVRLPILQQQVHQRLTHQLVLVRQSSNTQALVPSLLELLVMLKSCSLVAAAVHIHSAEVVAAVVAVAVLSITLRDFCLLEL
jgi:hypothetical protein